MGVIMLWLLIFFVHVSLTMSSIAATRESPASRFITQYYSGDAWQAERAHNFAKEKLEQAQALRTKHDDESCPLGITKRQELRNKMDMLLLQAAREIVNCMIPSMGLVKHIFDSSKTFHVCKIKWNIPATGPVPIEITESTLGMQYIWEFNLQADSMWVNSVKIVVPSLWTCKDNTYVNIINADILEAFLAHEVHHIINLDGVWLTLNLGPCERRIREVHELEADIFSCNYSKRSASGLAVSFTIDLEMEKLGAYREEDEHLQPRHRLDLVQQHSQIKYNETHTFDQNIISPFVEYQSKLIRRKRLQKDLYACVRGTVIGGAIVTIIKLAVPTKYLYKPRQAMPS